MRSKKLSLLMAALLLALPESGAFAQRGGRGGGSRGGGMQRGGGGAQRGGGMQGGGMQRGGAQGGGMQRGGGMQGGAGMQRGGGMQGGAGMQRGGMQGGGMQGGGMSRGGSPGGRTSTAAMGPYGGGGTGSSASRSAVGPGGTQYQAGSKTGSYTTDRGSTIDYGAAGIGAAGPNGGVAGRGAGAAQITTEGGRTYTTAGRAGGAVGPEGYGFGNRSSVGVGSGPNGRAVNASRGSTAFGPGGGSLSEQYRGGVAVGPRGVAAGESSNVAATGPGGRTVAAGESGGVAAGQYGAVAGGSRYGAASGPYGAVAGGSRYGAAVGPGGAVAGGAYGGAAVGRYGTYYASANALAGQGAALRSGFAGYGYFSPAWYASNPGAWAAAAWTTPSVWAYPTWGAVAGYCSYPQQPIYYDYGSTVVSQPDAVYINGDPAGTPQQFADQAGQIAGTGREAQPADDVKWQTLGVFALVQGDETTSNDIFQLAISPDGVLRGNYYNARTDKTEPVYGSVDPKSQRAAWTVGQEQDPVYEAGIANLTKDQTTMLVHYGGDKSQQMTLVRVEQPQQDAPGNAPASAPPAPQP